MRAKDRQYLTNLATTIIQQLHVPDNYSPQNAQCVYGDYGDLINAKICLLTPETLGRVASFGLPYNAKVTKGKTPLYYVHCGSYCGKYDSGIVLLVTIACTAIVAEIYDIFCERKMEKFRGWESGASKEAGLPAEV